MTERSRHQEKIIRNYYENRDAIALQRAQEIVSEIYLSSGKKRQRHWTNLRTHLEKLGASHKTIDHLVESDDPEQAAKVVKRLAE